MAPVHQDVTAASGVATLRGWLLWTGLGGYFKPEWVATLERITRLLWPEYARLSLMNK